MCVTDRHDMTLAVKVALNPNTTNQPSNSAAKEYIMSNIDKWEYNFLIE